MCHFAEGTLGQHSLRGLGRGSRLPIEWRFEQATIRKAPNGDTIGGSFPQAKLWDPGVTVGPFFAQEVQSIARMREHGPIAAPHIRRKDAFRCCISIGHEYFQVGRVRSL
jgi:hypothetical protein